MLHSFCIVCASCYSRLSYLFAILLLMALHNLSKRVLLPAWQLKSLCTRQISHPLIRLEGFGHRSFSFAGSSIWNSLHLSLYTVGILGGSWSKLFKKHISFGNIFDFFSPLLVVLAFFFYINTNPSDCEEFKRVHTFLRVFCESKRNPVKFIRSKCWCCKYFELFWNVTVDKINR